jgi:hypothetical protein
MRRLPFALLLALLASACHPQDNSGSGSSSGSGSGSGSSGGSSGSSGDVDSGPPPDAGPPMATDAGAALAPGFGAFTGTYSVNGGGLLMAVQVDRHLALLLNGEPQAYLGLADAGHVDGGFATTDAGRQLQALEVETFHTELVYPDLEDCGPVTLEGTYQVAAATYQAENDFCSVGMPVTVTFPGAQLVGPDFFRQDLGRSGVFDLRETPAPDNACTTTAGGPYPLVVGLSAGVDGGPALGLAAGDGLLDAIYVPDPGDGGLLTAHALDPLGRPVGTLVLQPLPDGGWNGIRRFSSLDGDVDGGQGTPCSASLSLSGSRRR